VTGDRPLSGMEPHEYLKHSDIIAGQPRASPAKTRPVRGESLAVTEKNLSEAGESGSGAGKSHSVAGKNGSAALHSGFFRLHPRIFREFFPFNPVQENAMPTSYRSIEARQKRYLPHNEK
jgi:hypothetical protein